MLASNELVSMRVKITPAGFAVIAFACRFTVSWMSCFQRDQRLVCWRYHLPSLLLRRGSPADGHVEQGGRDDDRPGDQLLVVLIDADEDEPVRDHPDDRGAEEGAEDAPGASEQARP